MGLGFSYISSHVAWRLFLGLQHLPPILMAVTTPYLPESPRFLIMKGRYDEALEVIKKLHGGAPGQDDDFYIREFNQIKAQHELEVRERVGLRTVLSRPSYRKRMFIVVFQFAFAMFTGIIPLQNYQFILYTYLGITNKMALVMVGVWGTLGTIFCMIGGLTFDKLGRRKSLLGSLWVQFLASIAMVICKSLSIHKDVCLSYIANATLVWAQFQKSGNANMLMGRFTVGFMFVYLVGYAFIMNAFGMSIFPYPSSPYSAIFANRFDFYRVHLPVRNHANTNSGSRQRCGLLHVQRHNYHVGAGHAGRHRAYCMEVLSDLHHMRCDLYRSGIPCVPRDSRQNLGRDCCSIR